jgi:hypothetical protein
MKTIIIVFPIMRAARKLKHLCAFCNFVDVDGVYAYKMLPNSHLAHEEAKYIRNKLRLSETYFKVLILSASEKQIKFF